VEGVIGTIKKDFRVKMNQRKNVEVLRKKVPGLKRPWRTSPGS
jgi:hypothetical protein